jgi:hypothetical protein
VHTSARRRSGSNARTHPHAGHQKREHQTSEYVRTVVAPVAIAVIVPVNAFVVYDPPAAFNRMPVFATAVPPSDRYAMFVAWSLQIVTSARDGFAGTTVPDDVPIVAADAGVFAVSD